MNASDILKYGHLTLMHEIDSLDDWDTPGVVGTWTAKDLLAHLASYEHLIAEVLQGFVGGGETPYLEMMGRIGGDTFNNSIVETSRGKSRDEVMNDYNATHEQVMSLVSQIPAQTLRQTGTIPWYGAEYSLDDYIVYSQYGHKREHSAQFAMFRDRLKSS